MRRTETRLLASQRLAELFRRNGYTRRQNQARLAEEGYLGYKKGYEVRLTAESRVELKTIRRLLREAGFRAGRPFAKGRRFRQPVYGREAVRRFLGMVRDHTSRS